MLNKPNTQSDCSFVGKQQWHLIFLQLPTSRLHITAPVKTEQTHTNTFSVVVPRSCPRPQLCDVISWVFFLSSCRCVCLFRIKRASGFVAHHCSLPRVWWRTFHLHLGPRVLHWRQAGDLISARSGKDLYPVIAARQWGYIEKAIKTCDCLSVIELVAHEGAELVMCMCVLTFQTGMVSGGDWYYHRDWACPLDAGLISMRISPVCLWLMAVGIYSPAASHWGHL